MDLFDQKKIAVLDENNNVYNIMIGLLMKAYKYVSVYEHFSCKFFRPVGIKWIVNWIFELITNKISSLM